MGRDADEPDEQRGPTPASSDVAVRLDEDLLSDILGKRRVSQRAQFPRCALQNDGGKRLAMAAMGQKGTKVTIYM